VGTDGVETISPAEESLPGGQALSRAVIPDQYVLGPGDGVSINIWGEYDDSYQLRVSPDGKISLPTIGDLMVKGLTLTQVDALIDTQVKKYYRNVKSGLSLTSLRVFEVLVLGDVAKPGTYLATPVRRVSDLIDKAGGILPSGSGRHIQVRNNGQVYASADLQAFLRKGDLSSNPFVRDDDVIFVPAIGDRRVSVYVSEVATEAGGALSENSIPHIVELKQGERLSTVISEVGGISPWWELGGVLIERVSHVPEGTMRISLDLQRYVLEKDESQNPVMEAGDQVYIPASVRRVFVTGAVKLPSSYTYLPGRTAAAYIAQAGGALLIADFDRSFIKRADGTVEPYASAAELNNGDTVVVLEKLFKNWQDYFTLVGAISGVIIGLVGFYAAFTNFGR
jgi:protein involved in polysaccharide export with SLBB domain